MAYYEPPSNTKCSKIRSRARIDLSLYSSLRSVRDLEGDDFCDPHDPCCVRKDPEIFLNKSKLREATRQKIICAPMNPHHFEYTILHRLKLRRLIQMAAERQYNESLTEEQLEQIKQMEEEEDMMKQRIQNATQHHKKASQLSKNPETNPPPPPKPVLVDAFQLKKSLEGLTNMALAHEIALNKDFMLKKPEKDPQTGETLNEHVRIGLEVKERYWKKIDNIMMKKNYKEWKKVTTDLLMTLRTTLLGIIPPHNLQMREKVHLEIDIRRIERQIDKENLDFQHYLDFILDTLSALCCPIRDKDVIDIRDLPILSHRVRKTLDVMEEVNLEMANFVLSQSRNHIIQNCVVFERNNFADFMEARYRTGNDPIPVTRDWIRRQSLADRTYAEAMAYAFEEVLDWGEGTEWPETLTLDWDRFTPIRAEIKRVTLLAVIVEAVYSYAQSILTSEKQRGSFESNQLAVLKNLRLLGMLREELDPVLTVDSVLNSGALQNGLENCCKKAIEVVDDHSKSEFCQGINDSEKNKIRELIHAFQDLNNPTRLAFLAKIHEWFTELAIEEGRGKVNTPHSLNIIGPLVIGPITEMIRLMMYNRSVFDVLYREIFDGNCPEPTSYPPKPKGKNGNETIILDANQYGTEHNYDGMDEVVATILKRIRSFRGRTMVYRRSKIDPRLKPMFESDGTPIVPPEMQPNYTPKELTAIEQKHLDEFLLATEPTLDEDYEGVGGFSNIGEPDWMFGYTTEQLLQIMERDNIVNANKLRRIKAKLKHETLQKRVAENLPVFYKIWGKEVGSLQKEFCRLQRIHEKGTMAYPPGATDEPSGKRDFHNPCDVGKTDGIVQINDKGEKVIVSRGGGGYKFGSPRKEKSKDVVGQDNPEHEEFDMETFVRMMGDVKEEDEYGGAIPAPQFPSTTPSRKSIFKPEEGQDNQSLRKPEPLLQIADLQFRIPKKTTNPVWLRLLETFQRRQGRGGRLGQKQLTMTTFAKQFEPKPSLNVTKQPSRVENYVGNDKATSNQTVLEMTLPVLLGKNVIMAKASGPQMPATSDVPLNVSSFPSSTTKQRQAVGAGAGLGNKRAPHHHHHYTTDDDLKRPIPPGLMHRVRQQTFSQMNLSNFHHHLHL